MGRFAQPFDNKTEKSQRKRRERERVEPPAAACAAEHKGSEAPLARAQPKAKERKGHDRTEQDIRRRGQRHPRPAPPGAEPGRLERVINYPEPDAEQQGQARLHGLGVNRLLHAQPNSRLQKPPAGAASS